MEIELQFILLSRKALTRNLLLIVSVNLHQLSYFCFVCLFNVAGVRPVQLMEEAVQTNMKQKS